MRRKLPGLKPNTEAMAECGRDIMFWVGERRIQAEAVPEGAVDSIRERMLV